MNIIIKNKCAFYVVDTFAYCLFIMEDTISSYTVKAIARRHKGNASRGVKDSVEPAGSNSPTAHD